MIIKIWPMMPTTTIASHAHLGACGLLSLERMYCTSQTAKTPMAYPNAPAAPLTRPWKIGPRGSNDGVKDSHRNTKAKTRSEERRVGKECRTRWTTEHEKKKQKNETRGAQLK